MNPDLNSSDENPYDFIFKQDKSGAPTPAGRPGGGANPKQMIFFGVFVVIILIVVAVAFSFISSASKDKGTEAITAKAYQNEISRVFEIGDKNARDSLLLKKVATLKMVLTTDQALLDGIITAKKVVPTPLQLSQFQNSSRDKALTDALQTDTHDKVYEQILDKLFADYYTAAKAAEAAAKTKAERTTLAAIRHNIEVLYATADETEDTSTSSSTPSSSDSDTEDNQPADETDTTDTNATPTTPSANPTTPTTPSSTPPTSPTSPTQ